MAATFLESRHQSSICGRAVGQGGIASAAGPLDGGRLLKSVAPESLEEALSRVSSHARMPV